MKLSQRNPHKSASNHASIVNFMNQRPTLTQLAAEDLGIGADTMKHVAPLGWEHLSLTGDYAWDISDLPGPGQLRPLRTKASLLAA